jgi:hypothetical protein
LHITCGGRHEEEDARDVKELHMPITYASGRVYNDIDDRSERMRKIREI